MRNDKLIYPDPDNLREVPALAATEDAGTHAVDVGDEVTLVNLPAKAAAAQTVTLPNVSEARGRIYSVYAAAAGGAGATISVGVGAESFTQGTQGVLATFRGAGDYAVFRSDGFGWAVLDSLETPAPPAG